MRVEVFGPRFTAKFDLARKMDANDYIVTETPPMFNYMKGWSLTKLKNYINSKQWGMR